MVNGIAGVQPSSHRTSLGISVPADDSKTGASSRDAKWQRGLSPLAAPAVTPGSASSTPGSRQGLEDLWDDVSHNPAVDIAAAQPNEMVRR